MTARICTFLPGILLVAAGLGTTASPVAAQSALLSNGRGFSLTQLMLRQKSGTSFTSVSSGAAPQVSISGNTVAVDDPPPLYNQQSRTYYVYFKWNGPNVAVPAFPHNVNIRAGEVCTLPNMSPFPLIATF